jgi:hypothetical protein
LQQDGFPELSNRLLELIPYCGHLSFLGGYIKITLDPEIIIDTDRFEKEYVIFIAETTYSRKRLVVFNSVIDKLHFNFEVFDFIAGSFDYDTFGNPIPSNDFKIFFNSHKATVNKNLALVGLLGLRIVNFPDCKDSALSYFKISYYAILNKIEFVTLQRACCDLIFPYDLQLSNKVTATGGNTMSDIVKSEHEVNFGSNQEHYVKDNPIYKKETGPRKEIKNKVNVNQNRSYSTGAKLYLEGKHHLYLDKGFLKIVRYIK